MILRMVLAAALLAACAPNPGPARPGPLPPSPSLAGTSWIAASIDDAPLAPGDPPTVAFGADNRVSGDSSCNRYMGPFFQTATSLTFGELASTRRACVDAARGKQEIRVLSILRGATEGRIEEGRLIIRGPVGRMVFTPAPPVGS